jgi:hypothetical protein
MKQVNRKMSTTEKVARFVGWSLRQVVLSIPGLLISYGVVYSLYRYVFIGY